MLLEIGNKAPEFTLPIQDGSKVSIKDYKGKWLIIFAYPKDNTSGCTLEAKSISSNIKEIESLNADVLGLSPDSVESHVKFIEKHELTVNLLSDEEKTLINKLGIWKEKSMFGKKYMGVDRTTFLINPEGDIAYVWKKVQLADHGIEIINKLKELQS